MSRLSRTIWWTALVAGLAGLLLSLVALTRSAPSIVEVDEVLGSAALVDETVGDRFDAEPRTVLQSKADARQRRASRRAFARVTTTVARLPKATRVVRPQRLRVPALGLDLPVRATGVARSGQMQLPPDPRVVGWYRYGPAPGSGTGSVVLAGHVDTRDYGIGPLAALAGVEPGALVRVARANGRPVTYRVDSIQRFDRQRLPDAVFSRSGPERLRLVTCTGRFLPEAGGYEQNLVVTAVPVRRS